MTHQAVFFDFGGTLFSYGDLREHFDALLERMAQRHGIEAPRDELRQAYRETMSRSFLEHRRLSFYLHRDLFARAHREFLRRFGADPQGPDGDVFYTAQSVLGLERVVPRSGCYQTLGALRQRGHHLAIVSNIDDDQFAPLLEKIGLEPYFDATTTSEEARSCKPDAGIFRLALAKAGNPDPERVVFVGDSLEHDVAGAQALGMKTVLVSRLPPRGQPTPDHVISDLRELLDLVRS